MKRLQYYTVDSDFVGDYIAEEEDVKSAVESFFEFIRPEVNRGLVFESVLEDKFIFCDGKVTKLLSIESLINTVKTLDLLAISTGIINILNDLKDFDPYDVYGDIMGSL